MQFSSRNANQTVFLYQNNASVRLHPGVLEMLLVLVMKTSRHPDGHSEFGMSFDGYPIYGPYGYFGTNSAVEKATPSYRLKAGAEIMVIDLRLSLHLQ